MGSATREAIAAANAALAKQGTVDLATGEQLLSAALVVNGSHELRAALADDTAKDSDRIGIVRALFGKYTKPAQAILEALATSRWSSEDDLVAGIEELGIRALASSAPRGLSIDDELFEFGVAVTSNSELELALGSKLGSVDGKIALVDALLKGKASEQTVAILKALLARRADAGSPSSVATPQRSLPTSPETASPRSPSRMNSSLRSATDSRPRSASSTAGMCDST
jgi:F-type H+-transporting ATPase subunit delta